MTIDYIKSHYGMASITTMLTNSGYLNHCSAHNFRCNLVAGRCIGAERPMMGSMRVMSCCFITGMVAGTAAALAGEQGKSVREIDIRQLQDNLRMQGAFFLNNDLKIIEEC